MSLSHPGSGDRRKIEETQRILVDESVTQTREISLRVVPMDVSAAWIDAMFYHGCPVAPDGKIIADRFQRIWS